MSGNTSYAVMAQRAEPSDSLDFFPTPPWATRALIEHVIGKPMARATTVWEPACGQGHMARPLEEYFLKVWASDIHDYGYGAVDDFLFPGWSGERPDWIITNPPFRLGQQFIITALERATVGVAVLVRSVFLEGRARYEGLFRDRPPSIVAPFVERVPMVKGRLDREASSATAYSWLVWNLINHHTGTMVRWIPPSRSELEVDSDYDKG